MLFDLFDFELSDTQIYYIDLFLTSLFIMISYVSNSCIFGIVAGLFCFKIVIDWIVLD